LTECESIFHSRLATLTAASFSKERQLINHSLDNNIDDEPDYADDDLQQDNETAAKGARFVKQKHGSTIDRTTVN
jgi:hypothetical protein